MRGALLALVALAACGPGGSFRLQNRNYNADKLTAERLDVAGINGIDENIEGVAVVLKSDPIASANDDEISVSVSIYWKKDQRPELNQEVSVGNDLAVRAMPRVGCFCGASDVPLTLPEVKGKFKLTAASDDKLSGDFELTFTGQIPYIGGGVLYENDTLKVSASGFSAL